LLVAQFLLDQHLARSLQRTGSQHQNDEQT